MTVVIDNDQQIKELARKRLVELAKPIKDLFVGVDGNIYDKEDNLIAEQPNYFDKYFFVKRMRGSARTWKRWFVGQYFTEEQKNELRLTDEDIAGRGMA